MTEINELKLGTLIMRLNRVLAKIERLKKDYASCYDPQWGFKPESKDIKFEQELALKTGKRLNNEYRVLTGDYYDYRLL